MKCKILNIKRKTQKMKYLVGVRIGVEIKSK